MIAPLKSPPNGYYISSSYAHLSYRCIHRKFGIFYRTGGDLLTSLSWALGSPKVQATEQLEYIDGGLDINTAQIMHEAGYIMNDLLHNEIKRLATEANEPREFNIDSFVDKVNPQLWQLLSCATSTVREWYNPLLSIESDKGEKVRKVRRFYILCLLMFCINPSCPSPIHTLLADTVEVCGGSHQLIKILNRLGATSSNDTHDRFVTHKAQVQQGKSVFCLNKYSQLQPWIILMYCKVMLRLLWGSTQKLPWHYHPASSTESNDRDPKWKNRKWE